MARGLRRTVALVTSAVMALTLVVLVEASPASAAGITTERIVYGRNEAVLVDIGQITFTSGCERGADDFIYPVADIYVISGTSPPSGNLSDVSGDPNTVFGTTGGGFFGELIGYTAPGGSLGPGTYSVVIDECQDGRFDDFDTFEPEVFRVTAEVVGPPLPGIAGLKSSARVKAEHYEFVAKAWDALLQMNDAVTLLGAFTGLGGVLPIAYMFITKALVMSGLPDPGALLTMTYGNLGRKWAGIAADPPDAGFAQPTPLPDRTAPDPLDPGDVPVAVSADDLAALRTADATAGALLSSLERYQGAAQAGDGEWMLHHARAIERYAALLSSQAPAEAAALDAIADAVEADATDWDAEAAAIVADADAYLAAGPDADQRAELVNRGLTPSQAAAQVAELRDRANTYDGTALVASLRAAADETAVAAGHLDQLATDMGPIVDALAADPFVEGNVPVADAGGPYTGSVGTPLALDASASTGPGELSFAWDLDGDGEFDDATGATPAPTPTAALEGVLGVQVTGPGDLVAVDYAPATITAPGGPAITSATPGPPRSLEVATGATQPFSVVATGDGALGVEWFVDGTAVATGAAFDWTPGTADAGTHLVQVQVTDGSGVARSVEWFATVVAPDADSDGYWATVDCDDTVATTYPGAPEILDEVDNDCDPTTADGGEAPVTEAGAPLAASEGIEVALSGAGFTHPSDAGTATVDWGDGTVEPAVVTGTSVSGVHTYRDDGVFTVEVCVTAPEGKVACDTTTATIDNEPALPRFGDLSGWTQEDVDGAVATSAAGNWTVAPDGRSVFQSVNGRPTFFIANTPLGSNEAGISIRVEATSDDDLVGFALGFEPGTLDTEQSDFLLVDWKQNTQGSGNCGDRSAERGLAISRVTGDVNGHELWAHGDCTDTPGTVTELARATNLGATAWGDNTTYDFRFRADEERVQIWVDDVLEIDLAADPGDPFPVGNFAFYNYSQCCVRYSGYLLGPGAAVEGSSETLVSDFTDPGLDDVHTGLWSWGDGTPNDVAVIDEADGVGTAAGTHTWVEDGAYDAELCLDDGDDVACLGVPVDVANAVPVVDAGIDRTVGAEAVLVDSTFTDAGILDAHTATVDWGDGAGPQPATVNETLGAGIVSASTTYAADGVYDVEVCVTDDDGDTGCDTFEVTANVDNRAPVPEGDEDVTATEGDVVTRMVAFTDANPADTHEVTVDWGDGTAPEAVAFQSNGAVGTGGGAHLYPEDGTFEVTFEVCDGGPLCDEISSTVTVENAAPEVSATASATTTGETQTHTVAAEFTDAGVQDTHSATVDWGEGEGPQPVPVAQGDGAGSVEADHVYGGPGTFDVEVCITDDDGDTGCDQVEVDAGVPGPPLDVSAIGGDGNARVRWEVPSTDGGSEILEYEVEPSADGANVKVPASELVAIVEGLVNDSDYTFRARARNANGWGPWSAPSNVARTRPACPGAPFNDVGPESLFCPEIKWMGDTGVSVGYPDGSYKPLVLVERSTMAAFTYRLLNPGAEPLPACTERPFSDVAVDNPFCAEITWMRDEGITGGYVDGTFRPARPVSRAEMSAFLYRLSGSPRGAGPTCTTDEYADVPASHVFCGEIDWFSDQGITGGYGDGTFRPNEVVQRQVMAAFIYRYNILTGFIT